MRGEESADVQWWMREHSKCLESRQVDIYSDADTYPWDYDEAWTHEDRPMVRRVAAQYNLRAQASALDGEAAATTDADASSK